MRGAKLRVAPIWLGLALALALAPGAVAAQPGISIVDGDGNVLTTFHRLKCRVGHVKGESTKVFKADAESAADWKLAVRVRPFTGFHSYDIPWHLGSPNFLLRAPDGAQYANFYEPPDPHPETGGALAFPGSRKVLGLGFISAFNPTITDGVAVGGRATCRYPRHR